jgi:hypothetical protein
MADDTLNLNRRHFLTRGMVGMAALSELLQQDSVRAGCRCKPNWRATWSAPLPTEGEASDLSVPRRGAFPARFV